jgi:extracellular matrix regulatory protein B
VYIHLGDEMLIKAKDIIAIIDKESCASSTIMDSFLHEFKDSSGYLTKKTFKSIIVTNDHIYFSPLASGTLKKRTQNDHL